MSLSPADACAIFAAGIGAGTINSVAGAGSLITFPTLLACGYGSVVANVTNNVGLVPGAIAGALGYRRELAGHARRLRTLLPWAAAGAVTGSVLLLLLPAGVFKAIVPALVLLSALLVLLQPRLRAAVAHRRVEGGVPAASPATRVGLLCCLAVYATAVYGGYFGAAQGVLLIAILGIGLPVTLQQANGMKNVLAGTVNGVAAVYFIAAAHVEWLPAALIAVGSTIGGVVGSRFGRQLHPAALRALIVLVGIGVAIALIVV